MNTFTVVIEIAKETNVKYEMENGELVVDRILHAPVVYPYNYGYVPETLAGDGDPLDALVIVDSKLLPGCKIKCHAVGVLITEDEKGMDEKVLFVPTNKIAPEMSNVRDLKDLNSHSLDKITFFFENYKRLEPKKWVKVLGLSDRSVAENIIRESLENYQKVNSSLNSIV
jgi:inorganic pyrophosphatase